jgi:hypothetical protein
MQVRTVFLTSSSLAAGTCSLPVILWLKLMVLNAGDDLFALLGGLAEDGRHSVLVVVQGVHRHLRSTNNCLKKTAEKVELKFVQKLLS